MKLVDRNQTIFVPVVDETHGGVTVEMQMTVGEFFRKFCKGFEPEVVEAIPVDQILNKVGDEETYTLKYRHAWGQLVGLWTNEQEARQWLIITVDHFRNVTKMVRPKGTGGEIVAEYVEVMKQKRRMCNSYALCIMGCPLNDIDFCNKNSGEKTNADFPEVERRVMSWAAEHPEPVYPTWVEYLVGIGVIPHEIRLETADALMDTHLLKPIPADIAQKLGIEPKEG